MSLSRGESQFTVNCTIKENLKWQTSYLVYLGGAHRSRALSATSEDCVVLDIAQDQTLPEEVVEHGRAGERAGINDVQRPCRDRGVLAVEASEHGDREARGELAYLEAEEHNHTEHGVAVANDVGRCSSGPR